MVRAGLLRHRVVIQTLSTAKDAIGGDAETWTRLATVWAEVKPLSAREALEAQRMTSTASHFITVRYRDDLAPNMRVVWRGRTFEISQVENLDGRDEAIRLWCSEVQALAGAVA